MRPKLLILALAGASAGFVGWRYTVAAGAPTPHHAIVVDNSPSRPGACSILGIGARVLEAPAQKNSTLSLLVLGDAKRAFNPVLVTQDIPRDEKVLESRSKLKARQRDFLQGLQAVCASAVVPGRSAILLGVERALEHLHAAGCRAGGACVLWIDTDGLENVNPPLQRTLAGTGPVPKSLSGMLDNDGIKVSFCGFGDSRDGSGLARTARTPSARAEDVWPALFRNPASVTIQPFCP